MTIHYVLASELRFSINVFEYFAVQAISKYFDLAGREDLIIVWENASKKRIKQKLNSVLGL